MPWSVGKPYVVFRNDFKRTIKAMLAALAVKREPDYALSSAIKVWYKTGT